MRSFALILSMLLLLAPPVFAKNPSKPTSSDLIRVSKDKQGPAALEIATARYRSKDGKVTVDLVGAVHVGERSYYQQLNREFKGYDAVLYELIADGGEGADRPIPVPGNPDNPLSAFQTGVKDMLGLTFQLDEVDYRPKNFVHADISPEEFEKSMKKKGESFQSLFVKLLMTGLESPSSSNEEEMMSQLDLVGIFLRGPSPQDRVLMRRILAASFSDVNGLGSALDGPGGSTLVSVRNQRAIDVMKRQIKRGNRHLAIYYGVAHMENMKARLLQQGFTHLSSHWAASLESESAQGGRVNMFDMTCGQVIIGYRDLDNELSVYESS